MGKVDLFPLPLSPLRFRVRSRASLSGPVSAVECESTLGIEVTVRIPITGRRCSGNLEIATSGRPTGRPVVARRARRDLRSLNSN
jgi:hypothetical protein